MFAPTIADYIAALEAPEGLFRTLFRDGQMPDFQRDIYGELQFRAGNSAAIFRYVDRFLKLYIRPNPHLRAVYGYVERKRPPILPDVRLLPDELWIDSPTGFRGWVDVVEGAWTPGETLEKAIARASATGSKPLAEALRAGFAELVRELAAAEWAHGDLKPENIIVESELRRSSHPAVERKLCSSKTAVDGTNVQSSAGGGFGLLPLKRQILHKKKAPKFRDPFIKH